MEAPAVDNNVLEVLRLIASRKAFYAQKGEQSAEIEAIQKALLSLGFRLPTDGTLGPQTVEALRKLQQDVDLKPTGSPNVKTVAALLRVLQDENPLDALKKKVRPATVDQDPQKQPDEKPPEQKTPQSSEPRARVRPQAISDGAVTELKNDALGFADYVTGLSRFLAAKETRPPLAIGITARWGQGKTSFMRMLDSELRRYESTTSRFVTSWFNPWLYSEPEQVWNAFISNVTSCVTQALPRKNRFKFHVKRFMHNLRSRVGFGFRFWFGSLTILSTLVLFFYAIFSSLGGAVMLDITQKYIGDNTVAELAKLSALPTFLRLFGAGILASVFYSRVVQRLDLGLVEYLQKKDFTVKAGALAQFQCEMEFLAEAVPNDLRVVIFIDDLDRCEKDILMEVISSLQVLTVSSKCYFVLGLDLAIVARQIEDSVLAKALQETDEYQHVFQHGSGFRFLEKVIQTRLSVPLYGEMKIAEMVRRLLPEKTDESENSSPIEPSKKNNQQSNENGSDTGRMLEAAKQVLGFGKKSEQIDDAPEIVDALLKYGPEYFNNPRSLKRFMNSFRMHAHLATIVDNGLTTDQIARYFVLAECWPGLLDYFYHQPEQLDHWLEERTLSDKTEKQELSRSKVEVEKLLNDTKARAGQLFTAEQPLDGQTIEHLCKWYGFRFYRAKAKVNQ